MVVLSNKINRDQLKPGDHIYSWRQAYIYAHHGIYVGEGMVVHFTRESGQETGTGTIFDRLLISSSPLHNTCDNFTRGSGQETGTGTILDRLLISSSRLHNTCDILCPKCGDQTRSGGVLRSCLDCFLSGYDLYLFEYGVSPALFLAQARGGTCTIASSDPTEDVVHRALFLLENGFGGYNVFKNNCEDFAIYCKTGLLVVTNIGVGRSGQASSCLAVASALVSSPLRFMTTGFGGLALVGCGMYCVSRYVSDIGVRRDAVKVPVEMISELCKED